MTCDVARLSNLDISSLRLLLPLLRRSPPCSIDSYPKPLTLPPTHNTTQTASEITNQLLVTPLLPIPGVLVPLVSNQTIPALLLALRVRSLPRLFLLRISVLFKPAPLTSAVFPSARPRRNSWTAEIANHILCRWTAAFTSHQQRFSRKRRFHRLQSRSSRKQRHGQHHGPKPLAARTNIRR